MGWFALVSMLAVGLAAWCGDTAPEPTAGAGGSPRLPSEGDLAGPELALEYQRSGGFAGFNDRLLVYSDGRVTLSRRGTPLGELQLDEDALGELLAAKAEGDFCRLPAEALPASPGADRFTYAVTDYSCVPVHTVRTADEAVPPGLAPLLTALDQLLGSFAAQ